MMKRNKKKWGLEDNIMVLLLLLVIIQFLALASMSDTIEVLESKNQYLENKLTILKYQPPITQNTMFTHTPILPLGYYDYIARQCILSYR